MLPADLSLRQGPRAVSSPKKGARSKGACDQGPEGAFQDQECHQTSKHIAHCPRTGCKASPPLAVVCSAYSSRESLLQGLQPLESQLWPELGARGENRLPSFPAKLHFLEETQSHQSPLGRFSGKVWARKSPQEPSSRNRDCGTPSAPGLSHFALCRDRPISPQCLLIQPFLQH